MESLDLTKRPPRGPREQLGGLVFLPRTIDKIRASLPGGVMGGYHNGGITERMLAALKIDLAELTEVVRNAASEDEVAAWVRAHSDTSKYEALNQTLESRTKHDIKDPQWRARFEALYDESVRAAHEKLFDVIEADDARAFP